MTASYEAAEAYAAADDLWVVVAYFNPAGFVTRRQNFERFIRPLRAGGVPHLAVECSFGGARFELGDDSPTIRVRARDVMWQKERLLNLAIATLPRSCTKVAWLDVDVLFTNAEWVRETSRQLDRQPLVQPYENTIRLPPAAQRATAGDEASPGVATVCARDPRMVRNEYSVHGSTGMAWAARRELLERCGLYDACIIGGGDHAIAHASFGDWESACVDALVGPAGTAGHGHFQRWAEAWHDGVGTSVGYTPGTVLHLWHGERAGRRYSLRHKEQRRHGFDPVADLRVGENGCWEWATDKPAMHAWAARYFAERREDGEPNPPPGGDASVAGYVEPR